MTFSFFGFWKHPKYKPVKVQESTVAEVQEKKEIRLQQLRKQIQISLSYGGEGGVKNKSIREMTEVSVDVERLRKGCFFSSDNTVYADIARYADVLTLASWSL